MTASFLAGLVAGNLIACAAVLMTMARQRMRRDAMLRDYRDHVRRYLEDRKARLTQAHETVLEQHAETFRKLAEHDEGGD